MNFISGQLEGGEKPHFKADGVSVPLDRYAFDKSSAATGACIFGIRPEHIAHGEQATALPFSREIQVDIIEPMGSDMLVWTKLGGSNLTFRAEAEKPLKVGDRVIVGFDPARASLFDAPTGNRI